MKSTDAIQAANGLKVAADQIDVLTRTIDGWLTAGVMADLMKRKDAPEVRALSEALKPLCQSCESMLAVMRRVQQILRQDGGRNV